MARIAVPLLQITRFSNEFLDRYVAQGMSAFTTAEIPDMSHYYDQSAHWVANYVLSMMTCKVKPPHRQWIFNFLRRAEAAFRHHELARIATLAYLRSDCSPSRYLEAISFWETYLASAAQAYRFLGSLSGGDAFDVDGSIEQKLNCLYNKTKHAENPRHVPADGTIPVWLTTEGLTSKTAQLTFEETAWILKELGRWANLLYDPERIGEKLAGTNVANVGEP